jgi:hypothetical protein
MAWNDVGKEILNTEIAVYQGDDILAVGTIEECAEKLNVKPRSLYYMLMPAYERKIQKRGDKSDYNHIRRVVRT